MKPSFYNIFFPYEGKMIGYNSLSDEFMVLDSFLYDLFTASVNEGAVDDLKEVHTDFFEALYTQGFIVKDDFDELKEIKRISYETDFDEEYFSLTINPTMNCNFKCWYCYETHIKDSKLSEVNIERIISFIRNKINEGKIKKFSLDWFGGEPLLYFNKTVLPLLEKIYPLMVENKIDFYSGCTSNGLLINQQLIDNCLKYNLIHFQITLDGHRTQHNKVRFVNKSTGSYDKIVVNIKLLLKNKISVTARINISEDTLEDLLKIVDDFKDTTEEERKYLTFSFHQVWQVEKSLHTDISSFVEAYRAAGFNTAYIGERNASITHSCYADKYNQALINYNGDVFKCTARDYKTENREGVLTEKGTIQWNDNFQKRMYETRFSNKPCLECKILPLCNGGCSQHRLEQQGKEYCIYNGNENSKLEVIKEKFYSRLYNQ